MMPKGGRLILTMVVLAVAPIHTMLATKLPKQVHETLWNNNNLFSGVANRIPMVAWRDVRRPVELGRLGIKDIKKMGCALRAS